MSKRNRSSDAVLPSEVSEEVGWFDRFAEKAANVASRAIFFCFCVLLVIVWGPTVFLMEFETSQLLINTSTTIITFLMVALLQNSQSRAELAIHHKLNAIAQALADMLEEAHDQNEDADELRQAVGLEKIESTG